MHNASGPLNATRWPRVSPSARSVGCSTRREEISRASTMAMVTTPASAATPANTHNATVRTSIAFHRAFAFDRDRFGVEERRVREDPVGGRNKVGNVGGAMVGPNP